MFSSSGKEKNSEKEKPKGAPPVYIGISDGGASR
jgi:hypothetical protein